jgi:hypothetical protein
VSLGFLLVERGRRDAARELAPRQPAAAPSRVEGGAEAGAPAGSPDEESVVEVGADAAGGPR